MIYRFLDSPKLYVNNITPNNIPPFILPAGYVEYTSDQYWTTADGTYTNEAWVVGSTHDMTLTPIGTWYQGKQVESMIVLYTSTGGEVLELYGSTYNGFNIETPESAGYGLYVSGTEKSFYNYDADPNYPEVTLADMELRSINFWSDLGQDFTINHIYVKFLP